MNFAFVIDMMQRQDDRDWVIKARFRFTEENDDPEAYWDEVLLNDMKRPCYAFRRGNILFTTTPPPRKPQVEKSCTSTCQIKVADQTEKPGSDFCEVCCGIRSPSFSRRAQSYTTHFCTRVPAKRSAAGSSSSDQRSKSTDSSVSSNSLNVNQSYRNLLSVSTTYDCDFGDRLCCVERIKGGKFRHFVLFDLKVCNLTLIFVTKLRKFH